ncbi:hypothetical protein J2736_005834 [Paenibacillus qinlingensis]|uniref:Uncharacterized protein n=1 Tax=Paenibacillus qinlingensis TaxID=1837343 RepID=A0ABU1P4C4_9BACL|nr:hypothetical protein [Paenibacillus qinlingensis]
MFVVLVAFCVSGGLAGWLGKRAGLSKLDLTGFYEVN